MLVGREKNYIFFWSVQKEGEVFFMFLFYIVVNIKIVDWCKSVSTKSSVGFTNTLRLCSAVTIGQIASIASQFKRNFFSFFNIQKPSHRVNF